MLGYLGKLINEVSLILFSLVNIGELAIDDSVILILFQHKQLLQIDGVLP